MSKVKLGILGAGKLGTTLGRLAIQNGYEVLIAGSKEKEKIMLTVEVLVPGAIVMTKEELVKESDVIILALPLGKVSSIPTVGLENKIIIDAMNYWWEVDGKQRIPHDPNLSSSEYVAKSLNSNRVVKAFNHMGYHDLEIESHSETIKAIALAGDNDLDKEIVSKLIEDVGFKPLDIGLLKEGIKLEPGSELFGANLVEKEFNEILKNL